MKTSVQKGREGEQLAAKFLQEKGYNILETNWRYRHKEIDIIAVRDNEIVFVEVKTRKNTDFGYPEEAVDCNKQKHLIDAAEAYMIDKNLDLNARFDVISIINNSQIKHYPYAFYPEL
ncbi:MAG TPA: YraN family protein [Bacteroidales bacterium]|nr:YraN family protein [Bacteroidales bacterium]